MNFIEKYVKNLNNIKIYTESIGYYKNPAILLIMGAMNQGIFWYDSFCEELANLGFYVIRYDHRDTFQILCGPDIHLVNHKERCLYLHHSYFW